MDRWLDALGKRWRIVSVIALGVVLSYPARPAGQEQDASIVGEVTDESGAVLPGVTVSATSAALQLREVSGVSDERGEYRLTPLPIGVYDVTYTLSGFQTVKREGIRLTGGFSAKLDVRLKVGALEETVTVSGASPVVDVTATATTTQLTHEALELTPTSRNSSSGLMAQTPGARPALDVGGDTMQSPPVFHAFGQDGESWQSIEGVNTTNPKSGNQGGNYWDYSSFEEAEIQTIAHGADTPTRGIQINAIFKSGGNDFHGTYFASGTGRQFQSNNVDDALRAKGINGSNQTVNRWDVSGELGGRMVRDKLWFYQSDRTRGDHVQSLDGLQPDGSPAVATGGNRFITEKLTYQMSRSNKITFFDTWAQKIRLDDGVTALSPWETRIDQTLAHHTGKIDWQWVHGTSLVSSVQFGYWMGGTGNGHWTGHTSNTPTTDLVTLQSGGASTSAGQRTADHQIGPSWRMTYYRPNWFFGNHAFKTGIQYQDSQSERPWIIGEGGNYQLVYRAGVPFELVAWNYPITPQDTMHYFASYVQDSWTIGKRLTLNLGARYAHDRAYIPEQCRNGAAPPPAQFAGPVQCFDRRDFNTWNPVVPRVHAAYDVMGNGKTVIKGGWARYAAMRKVDEVQEANPNVATSTTYLWHDLNNDKQYQAGEVNLTLNGSDFVSTAIQGGGSAALANGIPNPNEKEPMDDELSLSLEREVVRSFAVRVSGIYDRHFNTYRLQNSLRPPGTYTISVTNPDPGPDGIAGNGDDPGRLITYYEYPTTLTGAAFQLPWLVNDPDANQTYSSFEVAGSKQLSNRWQFMASYSATKKNIPIVPNAGSAGGLVLYIATDDPNAEINNSDKTWEWLGRAQGAYMLPFNSLVSFHFEHRSGNPQARTVLLRGGKTIPSITLKADELGSLRLPNINVWDMRLEKNFRFNRTQKFAVRLNVFNAGNTNAVTSRTVASGASYLKPTGIVTPRTFEFSGSYSF